MKRLAGVGLVVVSAAAFGTLAILGRYAFAAGMDSATILFLRFSLAAVVMVGLLLVRRERLPAGQVLFWLIGMGAIGYVGQAFAYLSALHYASPGLVALLLYLYPVFVTLLAAVWLHEPITRTRWLALGLALVGTALTVGPAGGQLLGILLATSAAAIYSVYILVGARVMKVVSAVQSSTVIFAAAGVVTGLMMGLQGPTWPTTPNGWAIIGAIVLVATVLPVVTFLAGLERIGPSNAAMLSTIEPVVTVGLAAVLLGEQPSVSMLMGGALILGAVLLLTRSEFRQ